MELTKQDLQAMRNATSVVVRIDGGKASVELSEKITAQKRGVTLKTELRHTIDAIGGISWSAGTKACFAMLYAQQDANWQALCTLVRPGDELYFEASDNSNGYLKKAQIPREAWNDEPESSRYHPDYYRLYNDWLTVTIHRQGKEVLRGLYLDHTISPNNSGRAIK